MKELYCPKCGKKLKQQSGEWTVAGVKYIMLYCPTAGPVKVDDDGWVEDIINGGHLFQLVKK